MTYDHYHIMPYFDRKEFACKCGCGFDTVDVQLARVVLRVRQYFNKRTFILSGCRCDHHNRVVGGASNSRHLWGQAADIWVEDVCPVDVYNKLNEWYPNTLGLILYHQFVHLDIRAEKFRKTADK